MSSGIEVQMVNACMSASLRLGASFMPQCPVQDAPTLVVNPHSSSFQQARMVRTLRAAARRMSSHR